MSTLQDRLLESINILAENSANSASGTKVIEAVVKEIVDAGIGEYKVSYLENSLTVYSSNLNIEYNIGDKVYVLIPNGDFSKQKVIISMSTPSTITYSTSEENHYMQVSDNLLKENHYQDIELCSYKEEERIFLYSSNDYFNLNFLNYLKKYNNFVFSVDIKTAIPKEQQINGNYGITLMLPFYTYDAEGNKINLWKKYTLDVNNISGNPYNLTEWSKQKLYIQIDSNELYDIDRSPQFSTFCKGFAQADDKENDIFIKNFGFYVYDVLSEQNQTGYYLHLATTEGNYFFGGASNTKTLIPTLKINGKDVKLTNSASEDKYKCYWFKEDAAVKTESEYYTTLGGVGWKCLNDRKNIVSNEEGNKTFDLITNNYSLKIDKKDVITSMRYKCVIEIVKSNTSTIVVDAILNIENLLSDVKITLSSITGSTSYIKNTGNVGLKCAIDGLSASAYPQAIVNYEWNRYDRTGKYVDNNFYEVEVNNNKEQEISFITSIIEELNTFMCSVYVTYILDGIQYKDLLGTKTIAIDTNGTSSFNLSIQNGDVLYKYDTDGDSPLRENYDGPLESKVNFIKPLTYTIFKADGSELTESEYAFCKTTWLIPKNSLIQVNSDILSDYDDDYYQVKTIGRSSLEYTLASYYSFKKTNNVILLKIQFNDIELNGEAPIKIVKEGENGTNNSNYTAVITHNGAAYGELKDDIIQKALGVYISENSEWKYYDLNYKDNEKRGALKSWNDTIFNLSVYKSGEIVTEGFDVKWSLFDDKVTNPCFILSTQGINFCKIIPGYIEEDRWDNAKDVFVNILEAKVTIQNTGDKPVELYAYYPIEIIRIGKLTNITEIINGKEYYFIPNCIGGFSSVLYASDGTNPQYNSSEPFTVVDSFSIDINEDYEVDSVDFEHSKNFTKQETNKINQVILKPNAKYDSSDTKNYISATINYKTDDGSLIYRQHQLKNKYDYAKRNRDNIISERDKLFNFINNWNLNDLKPNRLTIESFLSLRVKILDSLSEISNKLDILENYLQELVNKGISVQLDADETNPDFFINRRGQIEDCRMQLKVLDTIELQTIDKIEDTFTYNGLSAGIKTYLNSLITDFNSYIENDYNKKIKDYKNTNISAFKKFIEDFMEKVENNQYLLTLLEDQNLLNSGEFKFLRNNLIEIRKKMWDDSDNVTSLNKVEYFTYSDILNYVVKESFNLVSKRYKEGRFTEKYYANEIVKYEEEMAAAENDLIKLNSYIKDESSIIYIRPIVMTFNRYELSNISGWDGNRLYTGKEEEYLYAPQLGAGKKENDGSFTGIVMGNRNVGGTEKIGLYGFNQGVQTIELDSETGSAIFGKSGGGQIIIDPTAGDNEAVIKSGNYIKNESGMIINLSKPFIEFGSGKFSVDSDGKLTATEVYIGGEVHSGSGEIGGWVIGESSIHNGIPFNNLKTSDSTGMGHHGGEGDYKWAFWAGDGKFSVNQKGHLHSESGDIGGWTIKDNCLISGNITIASKGNKQGLSCYDANGNRKWHIYNSGKAIFNEAEITGKITSEEGEIGGWTIGANRLYAKGIELFSDGTLKCAGNWAIYGATGNDSAGTAIFNNAKVTGEVYSGKGTIGGWTIDTDRIYSTGVELKANGTLICSGNWAIYGATGDSNAGKAIFNNAEIKGKITSEEGEIGGWTIGTDKLSAGDILIKSDGTIQSNNFSNGGGWQINGNGSATFRNVVINGYTSSETFNTKVGEIENLIAGKATIEELTATNSRIDTLKVTDLYLNGSKVSANNQTFVTGLSLNYYKKKVTMTSVLSGMGVNVTLNVSKMNGYVTNVSIDKAELTGVPTQLTSDVEFVSSLSGNLKSKQVSALNLGSENETGSFIGSVSS